VRTSRSYRCGFSNAERDGLLAFALHRSQHRRSALVANVARVFYSQVLESVPMQQLSCAWRCARSRSSHLLSQLRFWNQDVWWPANLLTIEWHHRARVAVERSCRSAVLKELGVLTLQQKVSGALRTHESIAQVQSICWCSCNCIARMLRYAQLMQPCRSLATCASD
jgi:hypothetical protein